LTRNGSLDSFLETLLCYLNLFATQLGVFYVFDAKVSEIISIDLFLISRTNVIFGIGSFVGYCHSIKKENENTLITSLSAIYKYIMKKKREKEGNAGAVKFLK
jgi:hypothetical protein